MKQRVVLAVSRHALACVVVLIIRSSMLSSTASVQIINGLGHSIDNDIENVI